MGSAAGAAATEKPAAANGLPTDLQIQVGMAASEPHASDGGAGRQPATPENSPASDLSPGGSPLQLSLNTSPLRKRLSDGGPESPEASKITNTIEQLRNRAKE